MRKFPNIVLCGTPGTGKSTHATAIHDANEDMQVYSISDLVKSENLYLEYDEKWKSHIVDEDALLDFLEPKCIEGGCILDWHECALFPESWIDLVIVLTCDHQILYSRLEERGYPAHKVQENNTAEIMQVVLNDAYENYDSEIIQVMKSEGLGDIDSNVSRIIAWIESYIAS